MHICNLQSNPHILQEKKGSGWNWGRCTQRCSVFLFPEILASKTYPPCLPQHCWSIVLTRTVTSKSLARLYIYLYGEIDTKAYILLMHPALSSPHGSLSAHRGLFFVFLNLQNNFWTFLKMIFFFLKEWEQGTCTVGYLA